LYVIILLKIFLDEEGMTMEEEKIISIEERIPKLKEKRRKKANRTLLFYLTLFFLLIAIIVYLQSPFSNVAYVAVEGNNVITDEQVIAYSELELDQNIWRMNKKLVEEKIKEHPIVKDVKVERKLPQTVLITVSEKRIVGYIKEKDYYLPIVNDGVIITNTEIAKPGSAPLFVNFTDELYLQRFVEEINQLPTHILKMISEVHWKPTEHNKYSIVLYMNDGFIVNATIRDFANKMNTYPSIVAQLDTEEKGIIHMDVGVYVETFK